MKIAKLLKPIKKEETIEILECIAIHIEIFFKILNNRDTKITTDLQPSYGLCMLRNKVFVAILGM